jgi:hypothetical protein
MMVESLFISGHSMDCHMIDASEIGKYRCRWSALLLHARLLARPIPRYLRGKMMSNAAKYPILPLLLLYNLAVGTPLTPPV